MLKHKRAAKCPLLQKFLSLGVEEAAGNFVSTAEIYKSYESAVSLWTDEDSVRGQTKFLMKRSGFNRVGILQRLLLANKVTDSVNLAIRRKLAQAGFFF